MGLAEGEWSFSSRSDPRWRASGVAYVGMFMGLEQCRPALDALGALMHRFRSDPPDDLEFGYCKF